MSRLLPTAPLRRLAWSGVAATAVVAVGGSLAGGAGESWTGWWTAPGVPVRPLVGVIPALALFYGGMILVCRCWSRLRAEVAEGAVEWTSVVVIFVLWSVPLVLAPPLASRDVYAYAASGEVAAAGFDPYEVGPNVLGADAPVVAVVDPQWRDSPSPYGPLFVGVAAAVARASSGVAVSVLLLRVLALAGLLLATWGLRRLAGPTVKRRPWPSCSAHPDGGGRLPRRARSRRANPRRPGSRGPGRARPVRRRPATRGRPTPRPPPRWPPLASGAHRARRRRAERARP